MRREATRLTTDDRMENWQTLLKLENNDDFKDKKSEKVERDMADIRCRVTAQAAEPEHTIDLVWPIPAGASHPPAQSTGRGAGRGRGHSQRGRGRGQRSSRVAVHS